MIPELPAHDLPREAELHAIVRKALSADRDARYPSAALMLEDLEEYAALAGLLANPIQFGDWLMENFGREVVRERRARERAMRALARGPVLVMEPIPREEPKREVRDESPAPSDVRPISPPASFLPEYDCTPSAFMVAVPARKAALALTPSDAPTDALDDLSPPLERSRFAARLLWVALACMTLGFLLVRVALAH